MKSLFPALCILVTLVFSSCASILQSGPDRIPVRSEPSGAMVYLNGDPVGVTPMELSVPHERACFVEVKKAGYQTLSHTRGKVFSGWVIGSVFVGIVGIGIDAVTDNIQHYPNDPIVLHLPHGHASKEE